MFEERFRSIVKIVWLLPLVAAPGLILFGYLEAHQANTRQYRGSSKATRILTNLPQTGNVDITSCLTKSLAIPDYRRPCVALASAPGSGNTWVRHLLESVTGIYTGSIYNDKKLYAAGFIGELEDPCSGTVLVVKVHRFKSATSTLFQTAVVLVRNPYRALISEWNRLLTGRNHTAVGQETDFSGLDWDKFVHNMGVKWTTIIEKWLSKDPNTHIVYYEHLLLDARQELKKILRFLNMTIDPNRMDCTIANQEGSFHRKANQIFDPFTISQKSFLDSKIYTVEQLFTVYGKPPLPKEYYSEEF